MVYRFEIVYVFVCDVSEYGWYRGGVGDGGGCRRRGLFVNMGVHVCVLCVCACMARLCTPYNGVM